MSLQTRRERSPIYTRDIARLSMATSRVPAREVSARFDERKQTPTHATEWHLKMSRGAALFRKLFLKVDIRTCDLLTAPSLYKHPSSLISINYDVSFVTRRARFFSTVTRRGSIWMVENQNQHTETTYK